MAYAKNTIKFFHVSLVAICFGLGMVLFTELNIDYSHNRTTTSSKIDITEEITIPVVNEDFPLLSDYQEIIDRPLFMQDRQSYVYEEPKEELNQTKAKIKTSQQLVLTAIIITPDRHVAIIQTGKNKEPLHVAIGETIGNWTLEEVHAQHIILKDGEKTEKLELEIQGSPKPKRQRTEKKSSQKTSQQTTESKDSKKVETESNPKEKPKPTATKI